MLGPRPVIDAIVAQLQARLPEQLRYQLAQHRTDVTLQAPNPSDYHLAIKPDLQHYPSIFVVPGRAVPGEQTGDWLTTVREVVVIPELRYDTEDHLAMALQLYEPAVIDAVRGGKAPSPLVNVLWRGSEPAPIFQLQADQGQAWQSWVEITFEATVYEEERR